jgi:hypothetical protein
MADLYWRDVEDNSYSYNMLKATYLDYDNMIIFWLYNSYYLRENSTIYYTQLFIVTTNISG